MTSDRPTPLKILAPTQYPWTFSGPRHSTHSIERRAFLPFNYLSKKLEATTVFNPLPPRRFDLVHAFNRIPVSTLPFVIGYEDYLPRAFGLERSGYYAALMRMLASDRCRAIVAISQHARNLFCHLHRDGPFADAVMPKLIRRYPSVEIPDVPDASANESAGPLVLTFVGNDFGRKGGCVAVKLAEKALARGLPLRVEIVSGLNVGGAVWTDPVSSAFFGRYTALLKLPNVTWHGRLDNARTLALLRRSHFSVLATFGDSFGYSAIESMANGTPVIATRQGALPEFIRHLDNGILLPLETSPIGEWVHQSSPLRGSPRFETIFADEVERLTDTAFALIERLAGDRPALQRMRRRARETCAALFDARAASADWDGIYSAAVRSERPNVQEATHAA